MLLTIGFTLLSALLVGAYVVLFTVLSRLFDLSVELKAIQKSTHQIVMPTGVAETMFQSMDDDVKKALQKNPSEYEAIN